MASFYDEVEGEVYYISSDDEDLRLFQDDPYFELSGNARDEYYHNCSLDEEGYLLYKVKKRCLDCKVPWKYMEPRMGCIDVSRCHKCYARLLDKSLPTYKRMVSDYPYLGACHDGSLMQLNVSKSRDFPGLAVEAVFRPYNYRKNEEKDKWYLREPYGSIERFSARANPIEVSQDSMGPLKVRMDTLDQTRREIDCPRARIKLEINEYGVIKGELVRPAYLSLVLSGGKLPRTPQSSYFFTAYPLNHIGCRYDMKSKWAIFFSLPEGFMEKLPADLIERIFSFFQPQDTLHDRQTIINAEKERAANELRRRNDFRTNNNLPFSIDEDDIDFSEWDGSIMRWPHYDSCDEEHNRKVSGEPDMTQLLGKDCSGKPGYRCGMCNRRSENVGPRRGFCYRHSQCGGCFDLAPLVKKKRKGRRNKRKRPKSSNKSNPSTTSSSSSSASSSSSQCMLC